jgi:hypothetical protein
MPPFLWTQKQDIGPSSRTSHGLAYDSVRQQVVLFGGDPGGPPLGDTWTWDGDLWTQLQDIGPAARHGLAIAFDAAAQQIILFGGASGSTLLSDTWAWDGEAWTQLADTGPQARSGHALAFDGARQRTVLFGGRGGGGPLDDTWEWDGQEWTQIQDVGPSERRGHAMTVDVQGSRVVLFGGAGSDGTGLGDTWAWDGATWTQIADTGPEPRAGASMVTAGTIVLFGGINSIDPLLAPADRVVYGDSWRLAGDAWTKVQDIGPAPRWGHGMAFRNEAARLLLFGGSTVFAPPQDAALQPGVRNDTWEHVEPGTAPDPDPGTDPGTQPVEVESVTVSPDTTTAVDDVLDVTVNLTGPTPADITLSAYLFVDDGGGNYQVVEPPGFTWDQPITVPAGNSIVQFQISRDGTALPSGSYALGVGVDGGSALQGGMFTVA